MAEFKSRASFASSRWPALFRQSPGFSRGLAKRAGREPALSKGAKRLRRMGILRDRMCCRSPPDPSLRLAALALGSSRGSTERGCARDDAAKLSHYPSFCKFVILSEAKDLCIRRLVADPSRQRMPLRMRTKNLPEDQSLYIFSPSILTGLAIETGVGRDVRASAPLRSGQHLEDVVQASCRSRANRDIHLQRRAEGPA